jgi:uncharacterized protein YbjQ (UPF0145 family)
MAEWDGQGLPPAAQARVDRARTDHVRASLLTISGDAAVRHVGLDPVGEVMGCIVEQLGWAGYGGCGIYTGMGYGVTAMGSAPTLVSGGGNAWGGFAPYVNALYHGFDTAIHRMLLEAQAIGADGVVGVNVARQHLGVGRAYEFVARGTAVKARSGPRPKSIFYTDMGGADVAKSMHAGFMPHSMIWGISVGIRHDDYYTRMAARSWSNQNIEIVGYTELVSMVRADARRQFDHRVAARGATSATVSDMTLHIWEQEPSDGHRDHLAESIVVGNALVHFDPTLTPRTDSLVVVPLRRIHK